MRGVSLKIFVENIFDVNFDKGALALCSSSVDLQLNKRHRPAIYIAILLTCLYVVNKGLVVL